MYVTIVAFSMVWAFMALIMSKRLSAMSALILVPTALAIGGLAAEMGSMMLDGIITITHLGVMTSRRFNRLVT